MMPTQYQIEQVAGITSDDIAAYMMTQATSAAKSAMNLLQMQCSSYDPAGMELLKAAVEKCKREMLEGEKG